MCYTKYHSNRAIHKLKHTLRLARCVRENKAAANKIFREVFLWNILE